MPKDMSSVRYSRLLKIIALFQSKKKVSRKELELIGEYNVKNNVEKYHQNRTLQNDLDFLRDQGAEIEYNRQEKLYVLKNDEAFIINIKITKSEIEALSAGLKMVSHFLPHLNSEAHSLWEKLGIYVPHNLTKIGDTLATSTVIAIPVAPVKPDIFSILIEAKYKKSAVNIRYLSPNKEPRDWSLSPYDFYFRGNAWYMISFNHKHKALSIHRISRIIKAEFSSDNYVPAEEGVPPLGTLLRDAKNISSKFNSLKTSLVPCSKLNGTQLRKLKNSQTGASFLQRKFLILMKSLNGVLLELPT